MNNVLPRMGRPRFTLPQHRRADGDGWYGVDQISRPLTASTAMTSLGGCVKYIMPSATSGVASNFISARVGQPVLRFPRGIDEALRGDRRSNVAVPWLPA